MAPETTLVCREIVQKGQLIVRTGEMLWGTVGGGVNNVTARERERAREVVADTARRCASPFTSHITCGRGMCMTDPHTCGCERGCLCVARKANDSTHHCARRAVVLFIARTKAKEECLCVCACVQCVCLCGRACDRRLSSRTNIGSVNFYCVRRDRQKTKGHCGATMWHRM